MKNILKIILIIITLLLIGIIILFNIDIKKENKLIYFSFTEDFGRFDEITCYDDGISYNEELDISAKNIDITRILFFYKITIEYEKGNLCAQEFVLEESYIKDFLDNAIIEENPKNINIGKLIKGKTAIVSNKRYVGNDYENYIYYTLDGEEQILYIFYVNDLLVIQVGLSDEGPKFIAYN